MVAFYVASLLLIGLVVGWFGRRIYLRLDEWGKAMNRQDAIVRESTPEEIDGALRRVQVLRFEDTAPDTLHTVRAK